MPKDGVEYQVKTCVFAQLRGCKPWPARVDEITGKGAKQRFTVMFYGTHQTATVKRSDLTPYNADTREEIVKPGYLKVQSYRDALEELEDALLPPDGTPPPDTKEEMEAEPEIVLPPRRMPVSRRRKATSVTSSRQQSPEPEGSVTSSLNDDQSEFSLPPRRNRGRPPKKSTPSEDGSETSPLDQERVVLVAGRGRGRPRKEAPVAEVPVVDQPPAQLEPLEKGPPTLQMEEPSPESNPEENGEEKTVNLGSVSRSGRTIKRKRFFDDEAAGTKRAMMGGRKGGTTVLPHLVETVDGMSPEVKRRKVEPSASVGASTSTLSSTPGKGKLTLKISQRPPETPGEEPLAPPVREQDPLPLASPERGLSPLKKGVLQLKNLKKKIGAALSKGLTSPEKKEDGDLKEELRVVLGELHGPDSVESKMEALFAGGTGGSGGMTPPHPLAALTVTGGLSPRPSNASADEQEGVGQQQVVTTRKRASGRPPVQKEEEEERRAEEEAATEAKTATSPRRKRPEVTRSPAAATPPPARRTSRRKQEAEAAVKEAEAATQESEEVTHEAEAVIQEAEAASDGSDDLTSPSFEPVEMRKEATPGPQVPDRPPPPLLANKRPRGEGKGARTSRRKELLRSREKTPSVEEEEEEEGSAAPLEEASLPPKKRRRLSNQLAAISGVVPSTEEAEEVEDASPSSASPLEDPQLKNSCVVVLSRCDSGTTERISAAADKDEAAVMETSPVTEKTSVTETASVTAETASVTDMLLNLPRTKSPEKPSSSASSSPSIKAKSEHPPSPDKKKASGSTAISPAQNHKTGVATKKSVPSMKKEPLTPPVQKEPPRAPSVQKEPPKPPPAPRELPKPKLLTVGDLGKVLSNLGPGQVEKSSDGVQLVHLQSSSGNEFVAIHSYDRPSDRTGVQWDQRVRAKMKEIRRNVQGELMDAVDDDLEEEDARQEELRKLMTILRTEQRVLKYFERLEPCFEKGKCKEPAKAEEILEKILRETVTPLVLLKQPKIIGVIYPIRHYASKNNPKVQDHIRALYNRIRAILGLRRTDEFKEGYLLRKDRFERAILGMDAKQVTAMVHYPYAEEDAMLVAESGSNSEAGTPRVEDT